MFLTKECDYAIRVVRCLADLVQKSTSIICEQEQIPRPFAYKILKKLERADLVNSHRGASGGYCLAKSPADLTLFDIVNAVDERLHLNECLQPGFDCSHNSEENLCNVHKELGRIQDVLFYTMKEKKLCEIL